MKHIERALGRKGSIEAQAAKATGAFVEHAKAVGLLDVAYAEIDSPFGPFLLARTPRGLVRVAFLKEGFDEVLEELSSRVSPRVLAAPAQLDDARRQLDEYFERDRRKFDLPLDWQLSHGFALRVRRATARIPYGRVATYRDMAEKAGNVRATRAAGNALGSNPIPIIVPCHRVLRTGGNLGGYGGGLPMKEALLRLEGARQ